jgi:hypothetical protein
MSDPKPKLPRTAKGKRPTYFDPATDRLIQMVMTLMGEVSVMRDRLDTVERLIEKHGLFPQAEIDSFEPSEAALARRTSERSAYLSRMLRGMQDELDALRARQGESSDAAPK